MLILSPQAKPQSHKNYVYGKDSVFEIVDLVKLVEIFSGNEFKYIDCPNPKVLCVYVDSIFIQLSRSEFLLSANI